VFDSKNLRQTFGSKMTQQEGGENGTMRSVGGRIILKYTSKKKDRRAWTEFSGSGQVHMVGCSEHSNEPVFRTGKFFLT
jgi:hypothetical protein